ncbi:MAG: VWA domain-containing protein [Ignavibacteriales bacterium]|nr:MAG: VWA domain-containing protein [Ignavibacteriales bacterium]
MFGYDELKVALSFSPVYLVAAVIVFIIFTFFSYKYTVPSVSNPFRIFLVAIRSLSFIIIIMVVFEPVLTLAKKSILTPHTLIFLDNSFSIHSKEDSIRKIQYSDVINSLEGLNQENEYSFFTFGDSVKTLQPDSLNRLQLDENRTNFSEIFSSINESERNISSVVILSDGVITDGSNPVFAAEKIGIPVFTIGVGDTSQKMM